MKLEIPPEERGDRLMKLLRTLTLAAATLLVGGGCLALYWMGFPRALAIGMICVLILGPATLTSYISWREK